MEVIVCVLDSMIDVACNGIDANRIKIIKQFSAPEALIYNDKNGHGNVVCSIIHQINKSSMIYLFPVIQGENITRINEMLTYIFENRLSSLVNMSFGFSPKANEIDVLEKTCQKLVHTNIQIVAAKPFINSKVYPADFDSVIGVLLGDEEDGFDIDVANDKNEICVYEGKCDVWWRENYVISSKSTSFSTARITALLSLVMQKEKPEHVLYVPAYSKLERFIEEKRKISG